MKTLPFFEKASRLSRDHASATAGPVPRLAALSLLAVTLLSAQACEPRSTDSPLQPYVKVTELSGTLTSTGSGTMGHLMGAWAEAFRAQYPNLEIRVEGQDSRAAARALIEGVADLAPMSRRMDDEEVAQFEEKFGYRPTPYAVAVDAVVLYVHADNPLPGITVAQVNAVFSNTPRQRRYTVDTWGQLDLPAEWKERPINLYGREPTSGTYELFQYHVLKQDNFKDGVKALPTSDAIVQQVANDRYGLGYSTMSSSTQGVRILPVAEFDYTPFIEPTVESVRSSRYPGRRYLYIYVNQQPRKFLKGKKPLRPLVREFFRYIYSREGQANVRKLGYFTVEDWMIEHSLSKVG